SQVQVPHGPVVGDGSLVLQREADPLAALDRDLLGLKLEVAQDDSDLTRRGLAGGAAARRGGLGLLPASAAAATARKQHREHKQNRQRAPNAPLRHGNYPFHPDNKLSGSKPESIGTPGGRQGTDVPFGLHAFSCRNRSPVSCKKCLPSPIRRRGLLHCCSGGTARAATQG